MSLFEQILNEYKEALKEKNLLKKSTLNYIISQIKYKEKEVWQLSDDDIVQIIKKEIKSKKETISYLEKNNNHEDKEQEEQAIQILNSYLPKMLNEDELNSLIDETIWKLWIVDIKSQRWDIVKSIMSNYKSLVDGKLLNELIQKRM